MGVRQPSIIHVAAFVRVFFLSIRTFGRSRENRLDHAYTDEAGRQALRTKISTRTIFRGGVKTVVVSVCPQYVHTIQVHDAARANFLDVLATRASMAGLRQKEVPPNHSVNGQPFPTFRSLPPSRYPPLPCCRVIFIFRLSTHHAPLSVLQNALSPGSPSPLARGPPAAPERRLGP